MRRETLLHWYTIDDGEHYAELDVDVGEPDPQTGWPGDIEPVAMRIDGMPVEIRDHRELAERVLERETVQPRYYDVPF